MTRPLERRELPRAAHVLARAFHEDPYYVALFPDEVERARRTRSVMRAMMAMALPGGTVYTTDGDVDGVAVFTPPERALGFRHAIVPGLRWVWSIGPRAVRKLLVSMDELTPRHPEGPHWHLFVLGVDPDRQGKGLATALIAPTLARADADGAPVYLETALEKNLGYYAKHGFRVTDEFRSWKGTGPTLWTMLREPRQRPPSD